jgi:hypothetical protein
MAELGDLTADDFEPHLSTEFRVSIESAELAPVRLDEVVRLRAQPGAPREEPFSLVFSGPPPAMEQRMWTLSHPGPGRLDVFLVPIGLDPDGRVRYEAVFN